MNLTIRYTLPITTTFICILLIIFFIYTTSQTELSDKSATNDIENRRSEFYKGLNKSGIKPKTALYWEEYGGEKVPEGKVLIMSEGMRSE